MLVQNDFTYTQLQDPHKLRGREIVQKYPEVKKLMHYYPVSSLYILAITLFQLTIAITFSTYNISWVWLIICAWMVGASANHALFVMLHEAAHDLIWKKQWANRSWGIISNIAQTFPSAMAFRTYHRIHHAHMSEYDFDADLPFHGEARAVKNIWWRKASWFLAFFLIELIRPIKLKKGRVFDAWVLTNFVVIMTTNFIIFYYFGPKALVYLFVSSLFSVGLHPVGARWIQEHYIYKEGQETYSYYGIMNKFSFNVGFHNEHHDLHKIPWVNLPKLKALAPEYYNHLYAHQSWTKLLLDFIFNPRRGLFDRLVRNVKSELR